ncbi:GPW/gp25 family protein [Sphingosinicella sp. BN140058]|uniref:GPW/gp25 family protein n=1 Tax=Sphingosinicella sp. BN140058 TaxID=1892855 RepID=UPI00101099B0|nr:GPW/gp25 family protein [Sphingosinicella sp. BN140058]QAY79323.1 baseplate protein [Sphingosinicella sp. BN140058]
MDAGRQRDFLGIGWSYPVATDPLSGDVALSAYERDIKEAIRIILETAPGERVMRPRFGCGIHDLVFEEMSATTLFGVEAAVREALTLFEPRIELQDVNVDPFQATSGMLIVSITYRVRRTNQIDNLVYPFFFKEGGQP